MACMKKRKKNKVATRNKGKWERDLRVNKVSLVQINSFSFSRLLKQFISCLLQRWNSSEFDILQERNKVRKERGMEGGREERIFLRQVSEGAIPSVYRLPLIVGDTYHQIMKTAPTCFKISHLKFKFISLWAAGNWQFYTPILLAIYVKHAIKRNRGASPRENTKHKLLNKNAAEADLLWVI